MPDQNSGGLSGLWQKLVHRTEAAVMDQEELFVRGKVAGRAVADAEGNLIVDAGHKVDDAAIARARAANRLHALVGAVAAAQGQDLREKASEMTARTPEAREERALGSTADYAEARRYVGEIAGLDVTDIRGNIIVPAGKEINEDDVRAARQAGLLSALIFSAQQPAASRGMGRSSAPSDAPAGHRSTLPILQQPGPPPPDKPQP